MKLKNDVLEINFENLCIPMEYIYRTTGTRIGGALPEQILSVNGEAFPLSKLDFSWEGSTAKVTAGQFAFTMTYELKGSVLSCDVQKKGDNIEFIDFSNITMLMFDASFQYAKDIFEYPRNWSSVRGRGMPELGEATGPITSGFPQGTGEAAVHACGFNGKFCAFLRTDYAVEPLFVQLHAHKKFPRRSEAFSITLNHLYYDLKDVQFDKWNFSVNFTEDLNHDGNADENDYQLALEPYLKKPVGIYKDAYVYMIRCEYPGYVFTTFKQALEIVRQVSQIINNRKQIVYLVGWQYYGHDTGYPSFDKINERLGTAEDLENLVRVAAQKYNTTISVHINIDDSYPGNPGFNEEVLAKDIDGRPLPWEVFGGIQCYHVNHTKDVRSGNFQKRIDALFETLPFLKDCGSIHCDACRNINFSWEKDEFIGPNKEWYCGLKRCQEYLNSKGCDINLEGSSMCAENTDLFTLYYLHQRFWPVLYHEHLFSGGNGIGTQPFCQIAEARTNGVTFESLQNGDMQDRTSMFFLLRYYLLHRKMIRYQSSDGFSRVDFEDGTVVKVDTNHNYMNITTGNVTIADTDSRFIPLDDGIYMYQRTAGLMERELPEDYRNIETHVDVVSGGNFSVNYSVIDGRFVSNFPAHTLAVLKKGRN